MQSKLEKIILNQMDEVFEQTPQFFCSLDLLREQASVMQKAFSGNVAYAVKANPRPEVIKTLVAQGVRYFDVASIREANLIRELAPDTTIFFNNPIKTPAEISQAANHLGIYHYTVQSHEEIDKILKYASNVSRESLELAVRLKAPQSSSARINHNEKFGVSVDQAETLLLYLEAQGISNIYLSVHIGSDNPSSSLTPYQESLQVMHNLAKLHSTVKGINLGGGFPAHFYPLPKPDVPAMLQAISTCIFEKEYDLRYFIEPGLSLVANSTVLISPIIEVDHNIPAVRIRDGIYTSYYCYYIHQHPIVAYLYRRQNKHLIKIDSDLVDFKVYGQTCDGSDYLTMKLPSALLKHDMICVETAGAYMGSVASEFNGFGKIAWNFY